MKKSLLAAIFAKSALLESGWHNGVRFVISDGRIISVQTNAVPLAGDEQHAVILPTIGNLHSHAFQRAMAGMTERRGSTSDSFWSWRNLMYQFAFTMTPDDVEAVAAQLYVEMLESGFSRVGEFHYLHHDVDGSEYANIAELAERITAASVATGINLTLLPVFYAHSGFGGQAPIEGQRRFINSLDSYSRLHESCQKLLTNIKGARLGVAPHSLRAVTPSELKHLQPIAGHGPIHIHIAEPQKEVADCLEWSSARPVEWLLDNVEVDRRWCLNHATHMTEAETRRLAQTGAIAGLCPITEANLGDGPFPGSLYLESGGSLGIGSDSNVSISLSGELRQLEYSQRLTIQARNVLATANASTSQTLFTKALDGARTALQGTEGLAPDRPADFFSLSDAAAPYLSRYELLDHWIFADGIKVDTVWINGTKKVFDGRHIDRDRVFARFISTMTRLLEK